MHQILDSENCNNIKCQNYNFITQNKSYNTVTALEWILLDTNHLSNLYSIFQETKSHKYTINEDWLPVHIIRSGTELHPSFHLTDTQDSLASYRTGSVLGASYQKASCTTYSSICSIYKLFMLY